MAASISDEPTDAEVLEAIDILKRAGLSISITKSAPTEVPVYNTNTATSTSTIPTQQQVNPSAYINPEYETINMMLGNGNNNNDPMMNMLPYMINADKEGKNIDPQVIQTLMMNTMMNGLSGLNSTDNNK